MNICDTEARPPKGTGNGEPPLLGRKLLAFLLYVVSMLIFVRFTAGLVLQEGAMIAGMWMITYMGFLVIGGQAAIDSLVPIAMKVADAYAVTRTSVKMPEAKEK